MSQIEYSYRAGEELSERLMSWYEDRLWYRGPQVRQSGFRICRKALLPPSRNYVSAQGIGLCCRWICALLLWIFCGQY